MLHHAHIEASHEALIVCRAQRLLSMSCSHSNRQEAEMVWLVGGGIISVYRSYRCGNSHNPLLKYGNDCFGNRDIV